MVESQKGYDEVAFPRIPTTLLVELRAMSSARPSSRLIDAQNVAFGTHPGLKRKRNEDQAVVAHVKSNGGQAYALAVVCDGVGGSEMGDEASALTVAYLVTFLAANRKSEDLSFVLDRVVRQADDAVRKQLQGKGATTLSVLLIDQKEQFVATNVGDSRIFSWDAARSSIRQVSTDDTLENELKDLAVAGGAALDAHGLRGSLSQAIGEPGRLSKDLRLTILRKDDFQGAGAILASDGVWRGNEVAFFSIVKNASNPIDLVRRTIAFSNWIGGADNASIVAIPDIQLLARACNSQSDSYLAGTCVVWIGDSKVAETLEISAGNEANADTAFVKEKKKKYPKKKLPPSPERPAQLELGGEGKNKPGEAEKSDSLKVTTDRKAT
ncbi:MAG: serine/threonine-protein phosphatase [Sphingomonadales bacterium]|nr:MAG: serine/threonine-protein phosphatase [Sphingomonadales bacterium]